MMESSVKTISRPVIDHFPVDVNSLDEFACRQLDRLDRYRRPSMSTPSPSSPHSSSASSTQDASHHPSVDSSTDLVHSTRDADDRARTPVPSNTGQSSGTSADVVLLPNVPLDSTVSDSSTTAQAPASADATPTPTGANNSRWQTVLSEASGLGAALTLSEESMGRLRYCLQWLLYATAHIDGQILVLRDFIAQLQPLPSGSAVEHSSQVAQTHSDSSSLSRTTSSSSLTSMTEFANPSPYKTTPGLAPSTQSSLSAAHMRTLTDARRDIVHTIRQVVDVVSKYAGGALPEPARARVRGFILTLPQRWATRAPPAAVTGSNDETMSIRDAREGREREREERESVRAAAAGGGNTSARRASRSSRRLQIQREQRGASSADGVQNMVSATSPTDPRSASPMPSGTGARAVTGVPPGTAVVAAQRVLTLATESLDMMRGVTGVVRDSLDKADAWVGRLRAVGIQRNSATEQTGVDGAPAAHGNISDAKMEDMTTFPPLPLSGGQPGSLSLGHAPSGSHTVGYGRRNSLSLPSPLPQPVVRPISRSVSIATQPHDSVTQSETSSVNVPSTCGLAPGPDTDMDIEGEATRMSAMSLASRRGSLADSTSVTMACEELPPLQEFPVGAPNKTEQLSQYMDELESSQSGVMDVDV
ncbi:hypothetical protein HGRIS_004616 [Hohenbuehelia grisea]